VILRFMCWSLDCTTSVYIMLCNL